MARLVLLTVSLVALASCNEPNPEFCINPKNADDPTCKVGGPCTANSSCTSTPSFPVCDLMDNGGTCVQCTADEHTLCTGGTPHCEDHACVACVDDSDCGDKGVGVCMPTGGCADPNSIIHAISSGGSNINTCGAMNNACNLDTALTLARSGRNVIKLDDANVYTSETDGLIVDSDVAIGLTIDARGATLHRNNDGAILTINSGKGVIILGGTIEGASGGGGNGIQCNSNATLIIDGTTIATNEESAIDASVCTLTVRNATIRGNSKQGSTFPGLQITGGSVTMSRSTITSNRGGGIVVNNGKFEIVGNVFLSNGDGAGVVGGVSAISTILGNRLEFNTITQNKSDAAYAAGVQCSSPGSSIAQNNIIWNNNSLLIPASIQVSGGCTHAYSDIGPALVPPNNDSSNNLNKDPSFVNDMTDLHLKAETMVRGKANPGADLTGIASKDMAGRLRVSPADIGAYQAPAQ